MRAHWWGIFLGGLALSGLPFAGAHQELHHNIELNLRQMDETSAVQLTFTIHAPELLVGFSEAASAIYDSNWLEQRSDQELKQLVTLARDDLAGRFTLRLDDGEPVDLAAKLTFENPGAIRNGGARGLPPGCLEAFLELSAPEETHRLRLDHARDSGKRLLLVIDRPESFPGVMDVAPGSHAVVALRGKTDEPIAPAGAPHPDEAPGRARVLAITIVLAILAAMGLILTRLRRSPRGKVSGS